MRAKKRGSVNLYVHLYIEVKLEKIYMYTKQERVLGSVNLLK